jgi:uncharacterized protein YfkK (UPF0435 family)
LSKGVFLFTINHMSFQFHLQSEFSSTSNPVLFELKQNQQPFWQENEFKNQQYLVASIEQKNQIIEVGILELTKSENDNTKHIGDISNWFVSEQWQSRGVLKALLEQIIQVANDNYLVKLRITLPNNKTQVVAQNIGFGIIGNLEKEYFWNNSFWSATILEKFI